MAQSLWGRVYYKDIYTGLLQQEPNGRCLFTYDPIYLSSESPQPISFLLPLRQEPYICEDGLHPFFDNLVSEGLLQGAQARALGISPRNHFALLLGFGYDLAGAVSIIDPEPRPHVKIGSIDEVTDASLLNRASLSGVQQKLLVIKEGRNYRPTRANELSTHIAKFPSGHLPDIVELEYLTTLGISKLLPEDSVVELEISSIASIRRPALIVKRFDRTASGKRIHFEEFNQLLGNLPEAKYEGSYEEMGRFICTKPSCLPVEADKLYKRILACLLIGNTDAHFKNFAMFHTRDGLRLTPAYDLVAAARYDIYHTIALKIDGVRDLSIGLLKSKHLVGMGSHFGLSENAIQDTVTEIGKRLPVAQTAISESDVGTKFLRDKLVDIMEKRWKGSFSSIGSLLSKRQSKGAKDKN